ncbi:MAG: hypothetical protein RLZZ506_1611 [Bacteroidota bacterium]|jgi:DNA-directed RNA polymerase subunit RPC12/RpoP
MKHDLNSAKILFREHGLVLLESIYTSSKARMKYECSLCGKVDVKRLNDLPRSTFGCRACARKVAWEKRFGISRDDLVSKLRILNFKLLSSSVKKLSDEATVRCLKCKKETTLVVKRLLKNSCKFCRKKIAIENSRLTHEYVAVEAMKFGVSLLSKYKTSQSPIDVKFLHCGHRQKTTWNNLQSGYRCRKCARNAKHEISDYKRIAKDNGGSLISMGKNASYRSLWRCALGHEFSRSLNSILTNRTFCTQCHGSNSEGLCRSFVESLFGVKFEKVRISDMKSVKGFPLELDMYNQKLRLAFENNGAHHYYPQLNWGGDEAFKLQVQNDCIRRDYCKNNNILLIEVKEFGKSTNQDELVQMIVDKFQSANRDIPDSLIIARQPFQLRNKGNMQASRYWNDVKVKARRIGLTIEGDEFKGADTPIFTLCKKGHRLMKTPRSILQGHGCATCRLAGLRRPVRLSDGRVFDSGVAAARALHVSKEVINRAARTGKAVSGVTIERL